jgi:predicted alpha/beta superfamily hydrolase
VLEENRTISVYLPESYDASSQKFPVLYLLDGRTHFQHAVGAINFLSRQGIAPEMIIVSIHNIDRARDFSPVQIERFPTSGGADNFLNFIESELVPYVNENFKASDFRIIMGHSLGGTFITYSLSTKPELFEGYIAISPYLQYAENYVVSLCEKSLKSKYKRNKYYFMTIGNEPDYYSALNKFEKIIRGSSAESIAFSYEKMEAENHGSIPYISLFNGLRFIFNDWQLPRENLNAGLESIDKHYKTISEKYRFNIETPEFVINNLGYTYLQREEIEKSIEVFKENVKRYPGSANVYDSLGEAFEKNNQFDLAKENYQKAVDFGEKNNDRNTAIYKRNLERMVNK